MNFPSLPTLNQVYSFDGKSWKWNGVAWDRVSLTLSSTDIPDLPASKIISGLFPVAFGGTGLSSLTAGTVLFATDANTIACKTLAQIGAASDTAVVHLAGAEVITGQKTFNEPITFGTNNLMGFWGDGIAVGGSSNSALTGALVIKTNQVAASGSTMFKMVIDGYTYNANGPWRYEIGGYWYAVSQSVQNYRYQRHGNLDLIVHSAISPDGYWCVVLGETTTAWPYPKVRANLMISYSGATSAAQLADCSVSFVTDTSAYTFSTNAVQNQTLPYSQLIATPTTLAGYGITDRIMVVGTAIPASTDLNTYTTIGIYDQALNASAASGTNYPAPYAGVLEVLQHSTAMIWQRYTTYSAATGGMVIYTRGFYGSNWSTWQKQWDTGGFNPLGALTPSSVSIGGTDILGGHVLYIASGGSWFGGKVEIDVDADADYALVLGNSTGSNLFYLGMGAASNSDKTAYLANGAFGGGIGFYVNGITGSPAALLDSTGKLTVTGLIAASNFSGSSSGTNTGDQTTITGNAGTATKLATARTINGVSFDGSANITVPTTVGTLTFGNGLATGTYTGAATTIAMGVGGTVTGSSTNAVTATSHTHALTLASGDITGALGYTPVQMGTGVGQLLGNVVKIGWKTGSKLGLTVDTTDIGNIAIESWIAGNFPSNGTLASTLSGYATLNGAAFTGRIQTNISTAVPGSGLDTFAIVGNGAYGGGLGLIDGTYNWGLYDVSGTLCFGAGTSLGALSTVVTIAPAGLLTTTAGATFNGTTTVNCVSTSDTFTVNNPGTAPAGSIVQISSPAGAPGLIGNNAGSYRTDLQFLSGGVFGIAVSPNSAGTSPQFKFTSGGVLTIGANTIIQSAGAESHWSIPFDDYYMFQNVNNAGLYSATSGYLIQFAKATNATIAYGPLSSNTRVFCGYDSGTANSISCSGWFRSSGATGWYSGTYGGGVYMTDTTYVRAYNSTKMAAADFVIVSDAREKAGIRPFEFKGRLSPKNFTMKKDGTVDFGFIAQEVQVLYPEAVGYIEESDRLQLSYGKLTAIISYQVNRLEDVVEVFDTRVVHVEEEVVSLRAELVETRQEVEGLKGELAELRCLAEQLLAKFNALTESPHE